MQCQPGSGLFVLLRDETCCAVANAQCAEQPVGFDQRLTQHFRQLPAREPAQHFHLEQAILRMYIAQRAVQVEFVLCIQMGYAALVIPYAHRRTQTGQR